MQTLRTQRADKVSGLYVIIDPEIIPERDPIAITHQTLHGGASAIQLRDKNSNQAQQLDLACKLRLLCECHQAVFIINDSPHLAVNSAAHGLHLGQQDCSIKFARSILNDNQFIGTSNATLKEAISSEQRGADYIAVGAMFPTKSKKTTRPVTTTLLCQIKQAIHVPVVAIGGISLENIEILKEAKVDGICVIRAVCLAENPEKYSKQLLSAFDDQQESIG